MGGELGTLSDRVGSPELQLGAGHGHARIGEQVEIADVVVVDVADRQEVDRGWLDAQTRQCLSRRAQAVASEAFAKFRLKATVQDNRGRSRLVQSVEDPEVVAQLKRPVRLAVGRPPVVRLA